MSSVLEKRPSTEDDQRPQKKHKTTIRDIRDPVSLQELWRVNGEPAEGVLCYEELWEDGKVFVRGFELETIANLLSRAEGGLELRHPVSGRPIPAAAIEKAKLLIEEKGITAQNEDFGAVTASELTSEKMRFFALEVFQLLAAIDVRIDETKFMDLSKEKLVKLAMELREMMEANLPEFVMDVLKGNRPFVVGRASSRDGTEGENWWRQFVLKEIRRVFFTVKTLGKELGSTAQLQMLGYIVVGAMATVCPEIRQSFRENLVFSFDEEDEDDSSSSETF